MPRSDGRLDAGDKIASAISARAWNSMMDARDLVVGGTLSTSAGASAAMAGGAYCQVMAKNTSGSTIPMWGGCRITGITPSAGTAATGGANAQFSRSPTITVAISSSVSTTDATAVALQPIKAGQLGMVAVAGVIQCRATITDTTHTRLSLAASSTNFASGTSGQLQILWKEGTGTGKLALALFSQSPDFVKIGKTTSGWAKGASASIAVYSGSGGSETATGETVTAWNKFVAIASDKWVIVVSIGGTWYVIAAECS
jgi:hypothetical protein